MSIKVVIVGGGTGGHLFPGIAVAQEFRERHGAEVVFLTTPKPVTIRILEEYQLKWEGVSSRAVKGMGLFSRMRAWAGVPGHVWAARQRLKHLKPDLVLGMGGHASGPVGVAAWTLGISLVIHEQNAIPGLTNRLLGRLARRVFLSFPDEAGYFPPDRTSWTGNPIRREFFGPAPPRPESPFTVMVMGGSQGAHHLNVEVLKALPLLKDHRERLYFLHLTGEADLELVQNGYTQTGFAAEVASFTPEVAAWMKRAHLLVCRAGAGTLAELTALGRAALLIPYPFAANNHQEMNARFLEKAGAAEVILNKDFTGELLAGRIEQFLAQPQLLRQMEAASRALAKPDAAREIVTGCLKLLKD
uniref:UDP-N-acetylglucosamine--N-acetylmuramyl-(pentapeptide) pyrophosphoryl-undecaprenol N-acetylglucosamine transferase n=1 Tax=Desulfobacca acetoxidans TaxID=60893 RepID=A0A7C5EM65_9BACT